MAVCGRYANAVSARELEDLFTACDETGGIQPNFNVAPTTTAPVVVVPPGQPAAGARVRTARWGLVPSWARDTAIGNRLINARAETVAAKPAFRAALRARRCLVPATGYYEWHRVDGARRGQPYLVRPSDGTPAVFAGLYEVWRPPPGSGATQVTFTIITTSAAGGLEFLHPRSPVLLPRASWSRWLDPCMDDPAAVTGMLAPAPAGMLRAHPVSRRVGNVRNNDPQLLDPVVVGQEECQA
jgi:putative SOS response-associated peptidase YedK